MNKKNEKKNNKKKDQGNTFYEVIPAAAVAPQEVNLPKIGVKTADFLESVVIFFAGTAVALLLMRVVLMMFGIKGGNLLTYLLYAASYPFVLILNSDQVQVPALTNKVLYENVVIMAMYAAAAYLLAKLIRAMKSEGVE